MKIRIFKRIVDGVFDVRIQTEDWSQHDIDLMVKYGEPEVNLGGRLEYMPDEASMASASSASSSGSPEEPVVVDLDDCYVRVMTESPFTYKFDSRDYGGIDNAKALASLWAAQVEDRIVEKVRGLREKDSFIATEEIMEY